MIVGGVLVDGPPPLPVAVRQEGPGDADAIRAIHLAAFTGPEEAEIVDRLRAEAAEGRLSLVAVDGGGGIVGHALLTPCVVEDDAGRSLGTVLALGPVAVAPAVQLRGVGSALVQAAVGLAVARMAPAVVLLGYPSYYPRFGFEPARGLGLRPPAEAWPDEAWMGRLLPAWREGLRGTVRYPEAFGPLA